MRSVEGLAFGGEAGHFGAVGLVGGFAVGASLALVALTIPAPKFFQLTLAMFWLMAFASATHDIACDGLYMASLTAKQQAAYAGWQGAFFNASKFLALGGLMKLAGWLEVGVGVTQAWTLIFLLLGALLAGSTTVYASETLNTILGGGAGGVARDGHCASVVRCG